MIHIFKIQLENSDMFIKSIDFTKKLIDYSIRDKDTGALLEPARISPFVIETGKNIHFDFRFIGLDFAKGIAELIA